MRDLAKRFAIDQPVAVIDRLAVKPGKRQAVIEQLQNIYIPMAKERGLEYQGHFCLPAICAQDTPSELLIQWQYANVATLWAARGVEENDPRLPDFWAQLDGLLISRSRQLGRATHFDQLTPAGAKPQARLPSQHAAYTRWLAFVKPAIDHKNEALATSNAIDLGFNCSGLAHGSCGVNQGAYTYRDGEITCDILLERGLSPAQWASGLPAGVKIDEQVSLGECLAWGASSADLSSGVKRTILFDLHPQVSSQAVNALEQTLIRWAQQIKQIANWSLSKVSTASGAIAYTHCFEQEFTDIEAITTDYLYHPYHWSVADRYFHAEAPEAVANQFFHSVRPIKQSVLQPVFEILLS